MEKGLERYVRHDLGLGETARAIADPSNNFGSDILTKLAVIELSPYWSRASLTGRTGCRPQISRSNSSKRQSCRVSGMARRSSLSPGASKTEIGIRACRETLSMLDT